MLREEIIDMILYPRRIHSYSKNDVDCTKDSRHPSGNFDRLDWKEKFTYILLSTKYVVFVNWRRQFFKALDNWKVNLQFYWQHRNFASKISQISKIGEDTLLSSSFDIWTMNFVAASICHVMSQIKSSFPRDKHSWLIVSCPTTTSWPETNHEKLRVWSKILQKWMTRNRNPIYAFWQQTNFPTFYVEEYSLEKIFLEWQWRRCLYDYKTK